MVSFVRENDSDYSVDDDDDDNDDDADDHDDDEHGTPLLTLRGEKSLENKICLPWLLKIR